jgi:pentatricopeptide repeat protein
MMIDKGFSTNVTIATILIDLLSMNQAEKTLQEPNTITYSFVIDGYCSQNRMDEAIKVFDKMIQKGCSLSVVSYNILIHRYYKDTRIVEAVNLFREMTNNGMIPTFVTYNILIGRFCQVRRPKTALELLPEMQGIGQYPNVQTYAILLDVICKNLHFPKAMVLFQSDRRPKVRP